MQIVVSRLYLGMRLTTRAQTEFYARTGLPINATCSNVQRHDPALVAVVQSLAASDRAMGLVIIEVPDGLPYTIEMHDGLECVRLGLPVGWSALPHAQLVETLTVIAKHNGWPPA